MKGQAILILRPKDRASSIVAMLEAEGARVVSVPAVEIRLPEDWSEIDRIIQDRRAFRWLVFTSVSGVEIFFRRAAEIHEEIREPSIAAIGTATQKALFDRGAEVHFVPTAFTTEALGKELPGPPGPVALVRAEAADKRLDRLLSERGFDVDRVDAYVTSAIGAADIKKAVEEPMDAIVFTSPSIVSSFMSATGGETGGALVVCIGPATSDACKRYGLDVGLEAAEHSAPGIVEGLNRHLDHRVGPKEMR